MEKLNDIFPIAVSTDQFFREPNGTSSGETWLPMNVYRNGYALPFLKFLVWI